MSRLLLPLLLLLLSSLPARAQDADEEGKKTWYFLGKPVSHWVEVAQTSKSDSERYTAMRCFASLGENAPEGAPFAIEVLRNPREPAPMRRAAAVALGRMGAEHYQPLIADLEGSIRVAVTAMRALASLEPQAEAAIPHIAKALSGDKAALRAEAARALSRFGEAGVGPLSEALANSEPAVRAQACVGLGDAGEAAGAATPSIARLLKDADSTVRISAGQALARIGAGSRPVADEILATIRSSKEPTLTMVLCRAIKEIGPSVAEAAVPVLIGAAKSLGDKAVNAVEAIGAMGEAAASATPTLLSIAATTGQPGLRVSAIQSLGEIGPPAKAASAPLLETATAEGTDMPTRIACVRAIGRIGLKSEDNVKALMATLADKAAPADLRVVCAQSLGDLNAEEARALLTTLLAEDDIVLALAAKRSLSKLRKP